MSKQFTNEEDRMEAFFKLPWKILLAKNSIWAWVIKNLNKFFKWKVDSTKPQIVEDIEIEAILETSAVHPAWTFTAWATASLLVKKNGLAFLQGDIIDYTWMMLLIDSVVSDTEVKCYLIWTVDIEIPADTNLKNAGNSSMEWEVWVEGRGITVPRRNYNYTTIIRTRKSISRTYATERKRTTTDAVKELRTQGIADFSRKLEKTVMSPIRLETRAFINWKQVIRRYTGWIPYFIKNEFNDDTGELIWPRTDNVIAVNWVIWMTHFNQGFKYAIKKGGTLNTIAGSVDIIGSLADLEKDKINITLLNGSNALEVGWGLKILKSPIDVDGNKIDAIFITDELDDWEALMYDRHAVSFETMPWSLKTDESSPTTKDDNYRFNAQVEWTVVVQKANESFVRLTGITIA